MSERPVIEASYESRCPICDMQIIEGDQIALVEPDGEWAHFACAEEEP